MEKLTLCNLKSSSSWHNMLLTPWHNDSVYSVGYSLLWALGLRPSALQRWERSTSYAQTLNSFISNGFPTTHSRGVCRHKRGHPLWSIPLLGLLPTVVPIAVGLVTFDPDSQLASLFPPVSSAPFCFIPFIHGNGAAWGSITGSNNSWQTINCPGDERHAMLGLVYGDIWASAWMDGPGQKATAGAAPVIHWMF